MTIELPKVSMPPTGGITPKPKWIAWLWIPGILVGLYLVFTAIYTYAVRTVPAKVQSFMVASPWPVASAGWRPVWWQTYRSNLKTLQHYVAALKAQSPTIQAPTTAAEQQTTALTKVLRDAAILRAAADRNLKITAADIDQTYTAQITQGGNPTEVAKSINDLYGWTPEQFKDHVLRVYLARQKLQEALAFDDTASASQKKQAENVLGILKAGTSSFEDAAKTYSEDPFGPKGGDAGLISRGEQAKEIEDAAFALEVGKISDIIRTKYGFHILKVTEKKTVDGKDQVHLFEITITAPSVDTYITNNLTKQRVHVLLPGLRWDSANGSVIEKGTKK